MVRTSRLPLRVIVINKLPKKTRKLFRTIRSRTKRPEEIFAAAAMVLPSVVSASYLLKTTSDAVKLASMSCIMHCPWSVALHLQRAFSDNVRLRTKLYKFDVSFIHLHALLQGYSWTMTLQAGEVLYHMACIFHIATSDPMNHPKVKTKVDILAGLGVLKCAFGMIHYDAKVWAVVKLFWVVALLIHNKKLVGGSSSGIMHILLAVPQFCLLHSMHTGFVKNKLSVQTNDVPWPSCNL